MLNSSSDSEKLSSIDEEKDEHYMPVVKEKKERKNFHKFSRKLVIGSIVFAVSYILVFMFLKMVS
jgi:hypothetical protein